MGAGGISGTRIFKIGAVFFVFTDLPEDIWMQAVLRPFQGVNWADVIKVLASAIQRARDGYFVLNLVELDVERRRTILEHVWSRLVAAASAASGGEDLVEVPPLEIEQADLRLLLLGPGAGLSVDGEHVVYHEGVPLGRLPATAMVNNSGDVTNRPPRPATSRPDSEGVGTQDQVTPPLPYFGPGWPPPSGVSLGD